MTDRLFQRATNFVASMGQTPLFLGNHTALKADSEPDNKGRYTIRLWMLTSTKQLDYSVATVSYWRPTHSRLTGALHVSEIIQVATRYYLR